MASESRAPRWRLLAAIFRSRRTHIWALVVAIATTSAVLWLGIVARLDTVHDQVPWWVLALAVTACEAFPVHLEVRGEAHSVTLTEIPIVVGLLLAAPHALVVAQLLGVNTARFAFRRQSPIKHAFNAAVSTLDVTLAITLFHGLAGHSGFGPGVWAATLGVTALTTVCTAALVAVVIAIAQPGEPLAFTTTIPPAILVTLANTSLALGVVALLRVRASYVVLLVSPAIALVIAYRAYASERRERRRVDFLFRSTSSFLSSRDAQLGLQQLLREARNGFASLRAEVVLFEAGDAPLRIAVDGDDNATATSLDSDEAAHLRAHAASTNRAVLVDHVTGGTPLGDYLLRYEYRDAMAQVLLRGEDVLGVLVVGDRRGEVDRFTHDDIRLLEALAQQTAVVLHSDQLRAMLTDLQSLQAELAYRADHDDLTGLANRRVFASEVERAVSHACDPGTVAVMFLDIDDFKRINDSAGHVDGDELLRGVAATLREAVRPEDLPARLGGDEFAVLLRELTGPADADAVAQRVLELLGKPLVVRDTLYNIRVSIGVAVNDEDTRDAVELLRDADVAMYEAKEAGKGRAVMFAREMRAAALSRHALLADLERALEEGELDVAFQPIVALATGTPVSFEALARWNHPRLGWVPPAKFVPLAESAGLVGEIGRFVLDASCRQLTSWRARGVALEVTVSVNVSVHELERSDFVDDVLECIARHGLTPADVVLEITESVHVDDQSDVPQRLTRLREAGIALAMDDFGTGYASLSLLRWLPVESIKIDRTFVSELDVDPEERVFTRAIADLGQALGLTVVAEGIETLDQLRAAQALGCDLGQGYFFSPAVRAEAVPELVRRGFAAGPQIRVA